MLCALAVAVTFSVIGVGLLFIPGLVLGARALANTTRRLAGEWCGVPIAVPYLPAPGGEA